jgi:hypothetical protein
MSGEKCAGRGMRCDDDQVMRLRRICVVGIAMPVAVATMVTVASATARVTVPPTTESSSSGPTATNDLFPEKSDLTDCVGTVERANCGSRARADGHTYLVLLALTLGLAFIGWRIARGVRSRDALHAPEP